jgi:septal ring factor EnvC (AmiA/AmiB activator)
VADGPRPKFPWFLVAASVLLAALLGYTLFAGYLPAKQRIVRLERELKELYAREAELQGRLAQQEQRHALRERQLPALTSERDALARRLEELERQLAVMRGRRP